MQFLVPQFETEDKLFGPFTIIQFAYVGISVIFSFILFPLLTTWFWFTISLFLVATSLIMALVKINGRPMHIFIMSAFYYFWEPQVLTINPDLPSNPQKESAGLQHITPLSPSKKFDVPRQVAPTVEPATPSSPRPIDMLIAPATAPTLSIKTTTTPTPSVDSPAPTPTTSPSPNPSSQPFEISYVPTKMTPITPDISAVPLVSVPTPISPDDTSFIIKPQKSRLQSLFYKLTTTSSPLLFREETLKQASPQQKGHALIEKSTGETIVARRVDYR